MIDELTGALTEIIGENALLINEPMSRHTTFRIGGPAAAFVTPSTGEETAAVIAACSAAQVPYYVVGNGSNLLVSDQGYDGVVIHIGSGMNRIESDGECLRAEAGVSLAVLAARALQEGLTGLEFAAGIPGTLGGACIMNAGAYGGEMKQVLKTVEVMDRKGLTRTLTADELELGYRCSRMMREGLIVLSAQCQLKKGDPKEIRALMDDLKGRRLTKQPMEYPSAGSTFKRPEGAFAGKLIQDAGLAGYSVGGAQVSEKHCGFVINKGNATAADVCTLMRYIRDKVKEMSGFVLEPEVRFLGPSEPER